MDTPFDFSGYRVAVAGGSRGIGRAITLGFLAAGAAVSVCARGQEGLDALTGDAGTRAGKLHTHACDLHTSSIAAFHPRPSGPPYAAMKAALSHYTKTQALVLAKHRIRVNAI